MDYAEQILEIIETSRDHPTAEQIYLRLKAQGSRAVLATVYNNLARLTDRARIRRISTAGQPDRFDRAFRHDHLVCRDCGALSDICYPDLTDLLRSHTPGEVLGYELKVTWRCPACRKDGPPSLQDEREDLNERYRFKEAFHEQPSNV